MAQAANNKTIRNKLDAALASISKTIIIKRSYKNKNNSDVTFTSTIYPNPYKLLKPYNSTLNKLIDNKTKKYDKLEKSLEIHRIISDEINNLLQQEYIDNTIKELLEQKEQYTKQKKPALIKKINEQLHILTNPNLIEEKIGENIDKIAKLDIDINKLKDELKLFPQKILDEQTKIIEIILKDVENTDKNDTNTIKLREIVQLFGRRIQKGIACLGITVYTLLSNIINGEYEALFYTKNDNHNDSATGSLQYFQWCKESKQFWISDLCRVNNSSIGSPHISPIRVLLDVIEELSKENNINENYLMVDEDLPGVTTKFSTRGKTHNQIENEKRKIVNETKRRNAKQAQIDKLSSVYTKYGFETDDTCKISNMKAMKKSFVSNKNNNSLAKNMSNMSIKSGGKKSRRTQKKKKV